MFSDRLAYVMKLKSKTATDLAENCGINKGLVSKYLNGKTVAKRDNIYKIAKYLEIDPAYLLEITNEVHITNSVAYIDSSKKKLLQEEIMCLCSKQDEITLEIILKIIKSLA